MSNCTELSETLAASLKVSKSRVSVNDINPSAIKILQHTISFSAIPDMSSSFQQSIKEKYQSLQHETYHLAKRKENGFGNHLANGKQNGATNYLPYSKQNGAAKATMCAQPTDLEKPKVVLFSPEKVEMHYQRPFTRNGGLSNLGNSCFLNSVVQCLLNTPPFHNYLKTGQHKTMCKVVAGSGFCFLCELNKLFFEVLNNRKASYPNTIVNNIKAVAPHFARNQQEDAHEYLRYAVEAMAKSLQPKGMKLDERSANTTVVHQIFMGYLRSQVQCQNCKTMSNTFEPYMDLTLDIRAAMKIEDALASYCVPDILDGENSYKCESCKRKSRATKRYSLHTVPPILTLTLKRFEMGRGKINRVVAYHPFLDLRPYMSEKKGDPVKYELYAVLIHRGNSQNFGHYIAYCKVPAGDWFIFDDEQVYPTSGGKHLNQQAYILFYKKCVNAPKMNGMKQPSATCTITKPLSRQSTSSKAAMFESTSSKPSVSGQSTSNKAPKFQSTSSTFSGFVPLGPIHSVSADKPVTSMESRTKIAFTIGHKGSTGVGSLGKATPEEPIVMKIKDGKVISNTVSPSKPPIIAPTPPQATLKAVGPTPSKSSHVSCSQPRLVPYNGSSSPSSSDSDICRTSANGGSSRKRKADRLSSTDTEGSKFKQRRIDVGFTISDVTKESTKPNWKGITHDVKDKALHNTAEHQMLQHSGINKASPQVSLECAPKQDAKERVPLQNGKHKSSPNVSQGQASHQDSKDKGPQKNDQGKSCNLPKEGTAPRDAKVRAPLPNCKEKLFSPLSKDGVVNHNGKASSLKDSGPRPEGKVQCGNGLHTGNGHSTKVLSSTPTTSAVRLSMVHSAGLSVKIGGLPLHPSNAASPSPDSASAMPVWSAWKVQSTELRSPTHVSTTSSDHSGTSQWNVTPVSAKCSRAPISQSMAQSNSTKVITPLDKKSKDVIDDNSEHEQKAKKSMKDEKEHKHKKHKSSKKKYKEKDEAGTKKDKKKKKKKKHDSDVDANDEWVEITKNNYSELMSTCNQRKCDPLSQLTQSSLQGYGPSVCTWDGEPSQVNSEGKRKNRRTSLDEYEEYLDQGKVKKIRDCRNDSKRQSYNANTNPFQQMQNHLYNKDKEKQLASENPKPAYRFGDSLHKHKSGN